MCYVFFAGRRLMPAGLFPQGDSPACRHGHNNLNSQLNPDGLPDGAKLRLCF